MTRIYLTDRAVIDLEEIDRYSVEQFGRRVANRYLDDLDDALGRLAEHPGLFRERHDYTGRLRFYTVREHVFVADQINGDWFILTVWYGGMDFVDRLPELEPTLLEEAELLARRLEEGEE